MLSLTFSVKVPVTSRCIIDQGFRLAPQMVDHAHEHLTELLLFYDSHRVTYSADFCPPPGISRISWSNFI